MHEPRLFVITLLALRTDLEDTQVTGAAGASTILTVQTTQEAAEAEGWQRVTGRASGVTCRSCWAAPR